METVIGIIIGLAILAGLYYFIFRKKKDQPKQVKGFNEYNLKVANLTAKGMEENRDFVTAIIGLPEFKSKTPQQIEDWIKEKVGKEGTLSNYDAVLGLQELTYTTTDKTIDVFFLIVEKTSQNVINWKEPKPEPPVEPELPTEEINVPELEDYTDWLKEALQADKVKFPEGKRLIANANDFEHTKRYGVVNIINSPAKLVEGGIFEVTEEPVIPKRRHIRLVESDDQIWRNTVVQGINTVEMPKPSTGETGDYDSKNYAEHGIAIEGGRNNIIENPTVRNVKGDGIYIGLASVGGRGNENIKIVGGTTFRNGRQGLAIAQGKNITVDGYRVDGSGRCAYDLEPNSKANIENVVIKNGYSISGKQFMSIGGSGTTDGVLVENNVYRTSSWTLYCNGDRRNIVMRGNKSELAHGNNIPMYQIAGATNVLIENEYREMIATRSRKVINLFNCKGKIIIRNNDWPNAEFIHLHNVDPSQLIIYGNAQQFKFVNVPLGGGHWYDNIEPFELPEYDVAKYGEPDTSWADKITGYE